MNAVFDRTVLDLSANDRFKLGYPRYLRGAAVAVVAILALIARITPEYRPQPYVLRSSELQLIEIEEPPVVAEQTPVALPPLLPRAIEPVDDTVEVEPYEFPELEQIWTPTPGGAAFDSDEPFVASSANPVLVHFAKPIYPEIARLARLEGTVVVHVLVGIDGRVLDAVVVKGAYPQLDRAAEAAARLCRFTPGKQRAVPVKAWLAVPYRFTLR